MQLSLTWLTGVSSNNAMFTADRTRYQQHMFQISLDTAKMSWHILLL